MMNTMKMSKALRTSLLLMAAIVLPVGKSEPNVPVMEVTDLVGSDALNDFWLTQILTTTGLLAIRHPPIMEYRSTALKGLCLCMSDIPAKDNIVNEALLDDGITQRTTLGVGTAGTTPLALPRESDIIKACGTTVVQAMEGLRDQVSVVTAAFVKALDRILMTPNGADRPLLKHIHGGSYHSISAIQASSNHLEHFHVYSKQQGQQEEESTATKSTLEWHVDAGLFLSFVPALDCNGNAIKDTSFRLPTGEVAEFPLDSVVIMLGAGAQHWLDTTSTSLQLQATRHAVEMKPGQRRAWYGMMTLVPDIAIIQENPTRTFDDMKKQMAFLSSTSKDKNHDYHKMVPESAISIGCGLQEPLEEREGFVLGESHKMLTRPYRRRHLHGATPASCNNETNFFCWMSCLEIPESEKIDHYLHQDYSLYCMDPSIYNSQGGNIIDATAVCKDLKTANPSCTGHWAPTSLYVKGYDLGRESAAANSQAGGGGGDEKFCYGASTMLHDGFHWTSTVCVVYLFQGWVLTNEGKLAAACLGTITMGLIIEFILFQRRSVNRIPQGYVRLTASALMYGTQLMLGYFLMLVAMTFSGALFMCVIVGLVAGHVCFNAKDALLAKGKNAAEARSGSSLSQEPSKTNELKVEDETDVKVHDGITPCCQNDV